jgi:type VI secretion system protein ImpG
MFNKYYQDELLYLRDLGREFAKAHPDAAPLLAEAGTDPSVERLLEGVAFLAGRIRQKLDDELPELTHALLGSFFPHLLQPLPALTTLQFETLPQFARELHRIPRGTPVDSVPVDGTRCRFQTCSGIEVVPLRVEALELTHGQPARLTLRLRFAEPQAAAKLGLKRLRLHLAGDALVSRALHLCLCRYAQGVSARVGEAVVELPPVQPVGFAEDEALDADAPPSAGPFRLLAEYFAFPAKFMYIDVGGLERLPLVDGTPGFELVFAISQLPEAMPPVSAANIALNCTPAINRFDHDADPIRLSPERSEHLVRPAGSNPEHYEASAVRSVSGSVRGRAEPRRFRRYLDLTRAEADGEPCYVERRQPALLGRGHDLYLGIAGQALPGETLSITLACTNRHLPEHLVPGDIATPTAQTPTVAKFRNLTRPLPSIAAPLDGDLPWRFLSHLALSHLSLGDLPTLRRTLELYHLRARHDHQAAQALRRLLEGLLEVRIGAVTRMIGGALMRGQALDLTVSEEHLGTQGDCWLFALVLDRFVARCVSLNAFTQLTVRGARHGEVHTFPPRLGGRTLL